ncbi:sodium:proton antiporter [Anaerocolumna cellulosilytica]|uniref:Sodium:proton antiporter n=1 Tax=Anaerocolumna cellulosilytica TaxID=433286 RepID=A0A6S6R9M4_9FIRM|nr:cation:proton antiporter [Anaerocolumna cellulosilytica]MBB5195440.1 Kef-type K+ transport system membrane component KefB [Anaerocolumna cellulosilytica]BCJ95972.1 sodium:proton antiporter [Anaerocolumna cellulosilytica]
MEAINIFKDLAIIIISAKCFGILARKLKAPQVVGEIIAGLIIGPSILGIVNQSDFLIQMAEIGVILLMFMAGLETDLQDLIKTGPKALLIACMGVFIPLIGGYFLYSGFYGVSPIGSEDFYKAVFIGVILTATSVSITVQTLRELGKLKGTIGTTILSAAIIDDVIGIIVLTFVIGFKNPNVNPMSVIINTVLFFLFCGVVGFLLYLLFRELDKKYSRKRRIPIFGLVLCLSLAYIAEKYFGIADITGAYIAGIILCSIQDSTYIAEKMDVSSYMIFGPIFFASIGLKTSFEGISTELLFFSFGFVAVGLLTKIIGCGITSRLLKFNKLDSLRIGIGMMTRGEVALIVAQKGLSVGLLSPIYFTSVILLIIVSSIITPITMKLLYRRNSQATEV